MKVRVERLRRHFGGTHAVDDISFSFDEGKVFGFVGPNGAGKTTTMRIMATLDEPDGGDVFIDGVSVVEHPEEARRRIGFVPDTLPEHPSITIHEYLDFFARTHGLKGEQRRQVVADVEAFTGTDVIREKHLNHLSKGMKQRVSLARALIHDPDLLIMDEPAAGLDPKARIELRELIRVLAEQGKAIFISSHILDELGELCDGVVIIESGKLQGAGHIEELLKTNEATRRTLWLRSLGDIKDLHKAVLEMPFVHEAACLEKEVRVDIEADDEAAVKLIHQLVMAEIPLLEVRHHREDLEDLFMKVTNGRVQ